MPIQLPHFQRLGLEDTNANIFGFDAFQNSMAKALENRKNQIQLPFVPLNSVADASSKLAYSQLMGPQFIAKLLGNPAIRGNMQNPGALTNMVTNAGTTQGNLFNTLLSAALGNSNENASSIPSNINNKPVQSSNPELSAVKERLLSNYRPQNKPYSNDMGIMEGETNNIGGIPVTTPTDDTPENYAKKAGTYLGLEKEGEESGKIRAKVIDEFGQEYESGQKLLDSIDGLSQIATNPIFTNMRNKFPYFQDTQLWKVSKTGTPEEQELIGQFVDEAGRLLQNTYSLWSGKGLKGEFDATREFKINKNDTINSVVGKLTSAYKLARFNQDRIEFASSLMRNQKFDRQKALQEADKIVDRKGIMRDINQTLHPKPTMEDVRYMMQKYNMSEDEVMKELRSKGHM